MVLWLAAIVRIEDVEPCGGLSLSDPGIAGLLSKRERLMEGVGLFHVIDAEETASFVKLSNLETG